MFVAIIIAIAINTNTVISLCIMTILTFTIIISPIYTITLAHAIDVVLHTVKNRLHLNINPESVMITPEGQWKLCSFGFSLAFEIGEHSRVASPYFLNQTAASPYMRLLPDLRYCGPEMTEGGYNPPSVRYLTTAEDIFSLGVLIYELYKYNLKSAPSKSIHMR